jgi:hypothetical protein
LPDQYDGTVGQLFFPAVASKVSLTLMKYQKNNMQYVNTSNGNRKKDTRMLQWSLETKAESNT